MKRETKFPISISLPVTDSEMAQLTRRPPQDRRVEKNVKKIVNDVRTRGDEALFRYGERFDGIPPGGIRVKNEEIRESPGRISGELILAVKAARRNIEKFHRMSAREEGPVVETVPGVACWQVSSPIDRVGLYIPGGTAPLISTVLMLGVPAVLAGCPEVILCSPPGRNGEIHPAILYTASLLGIRKIFKTGGAQAIAAMAYGTETIPRVFKIFGPGNQYVTMAKQLVSLDRTAIDMPAGPSELMVLADSSAQPEFLAADLLSQAEHGPDSQVILLSDSIKVLQGVLLQLKKQIKKTPRSAIVLRCLEHSRLILLDEWDRIYRCANDYAPEHLIVATSDPIRDSRRIRNAGSVFLGHYTPESAGDYFSGTNHTLPTGGWARAVSGLTVDSFQKTTSFQVIKPDGLKRMARHIEVLAGEEGLAAHGQAVSLRVRSLSRGVENDL